MSYDTWGGSWLTSWLTSWTFTPNVTDQSGRIDTMGSITTGQAIGTLSAYGMAGNILMSGMSGKIK